MIYDTTILAVEFLFFIISTIVFLVLCQKLFTKLMDLRVQVAVNQKLLERVQGDVIDMGFQLFNLTNVSGNAHPGYVYIVKSDTGHYKIGRTVDFRDRAKTFGVKLPVEIEFLVLIETGNDQQLESIFHRQFRHKRVNGEWFSLSQNDLLFLRSFPGNILASEN